MLATLAMVLVARWPASRCGHCAVLIGDRAYLFGGIATHARDHEFVRNVECVDLKSNAVSIPTQMPLGRAMSAAAVLDGEIYIAGGIDNQNQDTNSLLRYDPRANTWKTCTPMHAMRSRFTLTEHKGRLYAVGAVSESSVEIYDPLHEQWTAGPSLPSVLHAHAAVDYQGHLTILGGNCPSETSQMLWLDDASASWHKGPSLNVARTFFSAFVYKNSIYAIGCHRGSPHPEVLTPGAKAWKMLSTEDCKAERFSAVLYKNRVITFGSEVPADPDTWVLDLDRSS
jgi:hypothetical protein